MMGKKIVVSKFITTKVAALCLVSALLASCVPSIGGNARGRVSANASGSTNVAITQGRVLKDNPVILSKNANIAVGTDLNQYLGSAVTITSNAFLQGNLNCDGLAYCFEVREKKESVSPLQTADGKWGFNASTVEFLQVNTFYHLNVLFDQYFANLGVTYAGAYDPLLGPYYDTAIPQTLTGTSGGYKLNNETLKAFANCDVVDNSYYEQSSESLCFGYTGAKKQLRWADDSTIIYHEAGHFFQKVQLNLRNSLSLIKVQMGNLLYTEAGSIGEGLSDFFSYYINGRTHWGEWAAGKQAKQDASRPLSESDPLHAAGISTDEDQRLSYPQYINYDPHNPSIPAEDVHVSGMIISHYLVALTEDIASKCSMSNKDAREAVMGILTETMSELGDLTSKGTYYGNSTKINLNALNSSLWFSTVNPITYRSFTQTIAKNLLITLGNSSLNRCNGTVYPKDAIESLLDNYGLLLFKTYNQNRNMTGAAPYVNTTVSASNRKKSVLISKSNLILDPTAGAYAAYVIDNQAQIKKGIDHLQSIGLIGTLSPQTPSDLGFNNGNQKVSPGEVVAIALNLYNNSNSTMGGIEVLANDWDHADTTPGANKGRPCQFGTNLSTDQWPLTSENGSTEPNCSDIQATTDDFAPVCFFQSSATNATKWVSQREFMEEKAVDSNLCLTKGDPRDCFIRAIKGGDKAYYSKINPKSTWGQTMANPDPKAGAYPLDWGNILWFEVSKHLPPGAIVDCRLRVRFTNCDDCFHDNQSTTNNDYKDVEYNGPKPYKIIHLQIPIID